MRHVATPGIHLMNTLRCKHLAAAVGLFASIGAAQASMVSLGNGTVIDSTTHLIWLQDWSASGTANWYTVTGWADNLTFAGSSDWRLPKFEELYALFDAYGDVVNISEFTHTAASDYWTSSSLNVNQARVFNVHYGNQYLGHKYFNSLSGVVVRQGTADDVPPTAVPEPQSLALALVAVVAAASARRKHRRGAHAVTAATTAATQWRHDTGQHRR